MFNFLKFLKFKIPKFLKNSDSSSRKISGLNSKTRMFEPSQRYIKNCCVLFKAKMYFPVKFFSTLPHTFYGQVDRSLMIFYSINVLWAIVFPPKYRINMTL